MTDLISRQALREAMYHEAFETDSDMQRWDSGCWIRYKMFENAIEAAPTIDPVKHGKWKTTPYTDYDDAWECSACGCLWTFIEGTPKDNGANYCPHCGARMDNDWEEPEINPCRGCDDYDWHGGCKSHGGCGAEGSEDVPV